MGTSSESQTMIFNHWCWKSSGRTWGIYCCTIYFYRYLLSCNVRSKILKLDILWRPLY